LKTIPAGRNGVEFTKFEIFMAEMTGAVSKKCQRAGLLDNGSIFPNNRSRVEMTESAVDFSLLHSYLDKEGTRKNAQPISHVVKASKALPELSIGKVFKLVRGRCG
jgi:hypothetical protein